MPREEASDQERRWQIVEKSESIFSRFSLAYWLASRSFAVAESGLFLFFRFAARGKIGDLNFRQ